MSKINWVFQNENGTNLNRYIATNVATGEQITFDLLRGANISIVGTPLNAENLNSLIEAINNNYDTIFNLKTELQSGKFKVKNAENSNNLTEKIAGVELQNIFEMDDTNQWESTTYRVRQSTRAVQDDKGKVISSTYEIKPTLIYEGNKKGYITGLTDKFFHSNSQYIFEIRESSSPDYHITGYITIGTINEWGDDDVIATTQGTLQLYGGGYLRIELYQDVEDGDTFKNYRFDLRKEDKTVVSQTTSSASYIISRVWKIQYPVGSVWS